MGKKTKGLDLATMDNAYHLAGGVVIGLVGWMLGCPGWQCMFFALGIGFGREIYQHLDRPMPWLNLHNVGEALSWAGGATVVWGVRWFV